jgi:hypothetical protein
MDRVGGRGAGASVMSALYLERLGGHDQVKS